MESLIISQRKLSCEVFNSFSANRYFKGRMVQSCIDNEYFYWQVHPEGYYESDNVKMAPDAKTLSYKIHRDHVSFRASAADMIEHLSFEWVRFKSVEKEVDEAKASAAPSALHFTNWFDKGTIPPACQDEPEERSEDVLIDMNGWRKDFRIGWYSFNYGSWFFYDEHAEEKFEIDHMRWTTLPLNKSELKNPN